MNLDRYLVSNSKRPIRWDSSSLRTGLFLITYLYIPACHTFAYLLLPISHPNMRFRRYRQSMKQ